MTQNDLLNIVINSSPEDWNYVQESPTFFGVILSDGKADYHDKMAIYKPDISIGMAWGLKEDDFEEDWATKNFIHQKVSSYYLDIFYNGMLVYRTNYVTVDGHLALMPIPKKEENNGIITNWITNTENKFFKLFSEIQNNQHYDSYIRRCCIEVR